MLRLACRVFPAFALALTTLSTIASADTNSVYTDPVGFYKVTCQSNADTIVSVPFTRIPEYTGLIESISENSITVGGSPAWTPGQWAYLGVALQSNHYYAVINNGPKEGAIFPITNNTANAIQLELSPEDLSGVSAGNQIKIIPYWTLITAFPDGSVVPSGSAGTRPTELLIPNFDGTNINQAVVANYYFFTNATTRAWRLVGGGTVNRNNDILIPDGFVIVRHNTATQTVVVAPGSVPLKKQRSVVGRNGAGTAGRDNYIALIRPTPVSLNDSGLYQSGAFRPSAAAGTRVDELLVFDNNAVGQNKSPIQNYYYFTNSTTSAWRLVGGGTADRGTNEVFKPGFGVILRANNVNNPPTPSSVTWVSDPPQGY